MAAGAFGATGFAATRINSKFDGVRIGAITYSFNRIASEPEAIVKAFVEVGLGEAELMSNHCEALAGAPGAPAFGRGPGAPPQARGPVPTDAAAEIGRAS